MPSLYLSSFDQTNQNITYFINSSKNPFWTFKDLLGPIEMSTLTGLTACAISSLCFGSMYVGVRIAGDPGDGMVVQWIYIATGAPPFQPLAMLGGLLWAIGNLTAIPIIKTIGLGMGILIWGTVNCVNPSTPSSPNLNYIGLVLVIVGGILFAFVRPKPPPDSTRRNSLQQGSPTVRREEPQNTNTEEGESLVEQLDGEERAVRTTENTIANSDGLKKRILAIVASVFAGIGYGSTFTPVIYIQDNPEHFKNPSKNAIDYVFSHFTGIYLTSTVVLLIYIAYKQNKPYMDNALVFPSLLAGVLWAVAMLAWFLANDILSQAITFPINAMLPGLIASLWSVFYFKEVEMEDLKLLVSAVCVTVFGVTLVGLSKTI
uniref:Transmembrane protein 144 n=1 Tax=Meloidogyne hapla TaxID=6305 RepID=A0A1I8BSD6_MELHA